MDSQPTYAEITTPQELRELLGAVNPRALVKDRKELHPLQVEWVRACRFCLVATSDSDGNCDVSPKGDPAGFTHVLSPTQIAIPERPGNRRADGFHNVLSNPHVGLIYFIPGRGETLRINGRARLIREAPFFDDMIVKGHRPQLAMLVDIEQIFFHCSKAFMRSELWNPESWTPEALPPHPEMTNTLQPSELSLEELRVYYGDAYADGLYKS
jgi:uncharacterized protein